MNKCRSHSVRSIECLFERSVNTQQQLRTCDDLVHCTARAIAEKGFEPHERPKQLLATVAFSYVAEQSCIRIKSSFNACLSQTVGVIARMHPFPYPTEGDRIEHWPTVLSSQLGDEAKVRQNDPRTLDERPISRKGRANVKDSWPTEI